MELNMKHKKFVYNLLSGLGKRESYEKSGFRARGASAQALATDLLKEPKIQDEIRKGSEFMEEALRARLKGIADDALYELHKLINNPKVVPQTKLEAITRIFDRIGLGTTEKSESISREEVTVIKSKKKTE